jgi:alkaline phosphatase
MKKSLIFLIFLLLVTFSFSYKFIFLFVADGMGLPHLQLANMYKQNLINKSLNVFNLPFFSIVDTSSLNGVTDSAAAITAILSGEKTYNNRINKSSIGTNLYPITYELKERGYKIGVISTNTLVDATPAGAYAFVDERTSRNEIVKYLLESNFDLFIGGGKAYFNKQEAEKHGYIYSETLKNGPYVGKELIALYYGNFPFFTDNESRVTLSETLSYAIKKFEKDSFFILIEGGRIDHAAHAHDTISLIKEIIDFDDSIKIALDFLKQYPNDTLIIVTSDHATGGLTLGDGFLSLNKIKDYGFSYEKFVEVLNSTNNYEDFSNKLNLNIDLKNYFYISKNSSKTLTYQSDVVKFYYDNLNNQAGINWSSFGHTADYVALFSNITCDVYFIKNNEIFSVFEIF